MHAARQIAQRNHEAALRALRAAEDGADLSKCLAAEAAADVTRRALIEAEEAYPTADEQRRAARRLMLRNRGWGA